jgi:hypothetical protein
MARRSADPHCLLPTAYCLLPTAYCLLPTAYCLPRPLFAFYTQTGLAMIAVAGRRTRGLAG